MNEQPRQQVSAQTVDPWSARRAALYGIAQHAAWPWAKELMSRTHRNVVVVALANKLARIAWAVLQRGKPFDVKAVQHRGRAHHKKLAQISVTHFRDAP